MKHLHFTQSIEALQGGGLGKAAIDLHKAFLSIGASSHFVSTFEGKTDLKIPKSVIGLRTGPGKAFYSKTIKEQASKWSREMDIFHGHGFYVYPNWALGSAARKNAKPLVYHPHGFLEPWILARSRMAKKVAHFLFETKNFAYAQLWRALTEKEADQIRTCGITAPIVVAANGVHLEEYDREVSAELQLKKRKKQILFMARIHPKKGLKILLEIWPQIKEQFPDWEIIVAGPDEGGHRAELESIIAAHGTSDSVKFIGTISGDTKLAWLKSCDLFILPSYSEGFSVAVLEAMTCGKPVLITSGCNFPEVARENAGWICEADHESVASSLRIALDTPEEDLAAMGGNGRQLVEKKYAWTKIASTIIDATHEI
ncbi:MAG: glycosyltransferase [Verrucomicrobiae bacterium]|nr:glycosyltransferase [Verrucomicrobiae bacterium]